MAGLSWDKIKSFDDIISDDMKKLISKLEEEKETRCPYLRKEGSWFYYCGVRLPEVNDKRLEPSNPIYQRHVDLVDMSLYCLNRFGVCTHNPERTG